MSYLYFEDNELDDMFKAVNRLQFCFHPTYAPDGQFTVHNTFQLQSSDTDITIIADKNLVSPICEIAKNGALKDDYRMRKVALFVTWTKYLNARLTCGLGLLENDTAGLSTASGEESRLRFLHGVNNIPAIIWKDIAFGYRDCVPELFLYQDIVNEEKEYKLQDDLLLLSNEASVVKISQLIRTSNMQPIDKFICFMNWYTDNLDIAESIVVYAAMVFASIPHVALPKNTYSKSFQKLTKGIKNQAWDITYIAVWSMKYYNEAPETCTMFATDDNTQKIIIVNVLPPGECSKALEVIFKTKSEKKKLKEFNDAKLGDARVRPLSHMNDEEKISAVKSLLNREYDILRNMCE